jgi:CHAD domain-containing protein
MARAREIENLDCADPFALSAARIVEVRADELFEHSNGVLDTTEIEALHDMRVASRRLRAAMEIFKPCFPRKPFRRTLNQVKELADALGERRDRDVAISFLEDFSEHVTAPDRRGIATLLDGLREEQAAANERLGPFVSAARLAALRKEVVELCDWARDSIPPQQPEEEEAEAQPEAEAASVGDPAANGQRQIGQPAP